MKQSLPISLLIIAAFCSLFCSCTSEGERQRMAQIIAEADSLNRNYIPLTSDSLLLEACQYYDRFGSPNERMKAHYLLGCVYRDLGEAPRAIECYQNAIACADTTADDCDFQKLGCVYSQMGDVFHRQLLYNYEIEARKHATYYAYLAKDSINGIYDYKTMASSYMLMQKYDSAEHILKESVRLYLQFGDEQEALNTSLYQMFLYIHQPNKTKELMQLVDKYNSESKLFDEKRELPPNKRHFYYYKGFCFESLGLLDSAEYYYRRIYYPNIHLNDAIPMYQGLLSTFKRKGESDSIAKYARLYCAVNDSSFVLKDQKLTARLAASYNYAYYQKQSLDNEKKAYHRLLLAFVLLILLLIGIMIAVILRNRYKEIVREKKAELGKIRQEYAKTIEAYEEKYSHLHQLKIGYQQTANIVSQELGKVRTENANMRSDNAELKCIISKLNTQYEENKTELTKELDSYIVKVEELEQKISKLEAHKIPFLSLGIVKRIKLHAENERERLSENDLRNLLNAVTESFPELIFKLNNTVGIGTLGIYVCTLVLINLTSKEITFLLDISPSQVANIKRDLNIALFGESSATTLNRNLSNKYKQSLL